ncbi:hypothetical protein CIRG_08400 [Coccidioides immitis RMSCC 2394]|uniref:Uncharacterized protein n=1 Tax=Coccidioides immitis RMSCC 2394 TaxID=404692 RepID=A0A0J6YNH3_COCIT|nr:hypothetical protein CIRG_08400 [Coccidioides immitis RMSCC 2394]
MTTGSSSVRTEFACSIPTNRLSRRRPADNVGRRTTGDGPPDRNRPWLDINERRRKEKNKHPLSRLTSPYLLTVFPNDQGFLPSIPLALCPRGPRYHSYLKYPYPSKPSHPGKLGSRLVDRYFAWRVAPET